MAFDNMAQDTADDRAAVTNLNTENSTLTEQVALYANRLSTKATNKVALQTTIKNLQGEVKKLKAEVENLKRPGHSGAAGAANKDNERMTPKWKQ